MDHLSEQSSGVDAFLDKVTTNIITSAVKRAATVENKLCIEEEAILTELEANSSFESLLNDNSIVDNEFEGMTNDFYDMEEDIIYNKCCLVVQRSLREAYNEVKEVLDARKSGYEEARLRLLLCMRNSERIQNYFREISINVIENATKRASEKAFILNENIHQTEVSGMSQNGTPELNGEENTSEKTFSVGRSLQNANTGSENWEKFEGINREMSQILCQDVSSNTVSDIKSGIPCNRERGSETNIYMNKTEDEQEHVLRHTQFEVKCDDLTNTVRVGNHQHSDLDGDSEAYGDTDNKSDIVNSICMPTGKTLLNIHSLSNRDSEVIQSMDLEPDQLDSSVLDTNEQSNTFVPQIPRFTMSSADKHDSSFEPGNLNSVKNIVDFNSTSKVDENKSIFRSSELYNTALEASPNVESGFEEEISQQEVFVTANSEMFDSDDNTQSGLNSNLELFTTANTLQPGLESSDFLSFDSNTDCSEEFPGKQDRFKNIVSPVLVDTTITGVKHPRQSTPYVEEDTNNGPQIKFKGDALDIQPWEDQGSPYLTPTVSISEVEIFTDDEESSFEPDTPRTLSRQSSAFGNVTLEFDNDWESGLHDFSDKKYASPKQEEKHTVILHELSFDERADLRPPELLGPVFLAVLDDDEDEDNTVKKKHRLSQSIDDLCEMISDDDGGDCEQTSVPLRRRAMSLETRRPFLTTQQTKIPTKDELMRAFQELRNEILLDKDYEEEGTKIIEDNLSMEGDEECEMRLDDIVLERADSIETTGERGDKLGNSELMVINDSGCVQDEMFKPGDESPRDEPVALFENDTKLNTNKFVDLESVEEERMPCSEEMEHAELSRLELSREDEILNVEQSERSVLSNVSLSMNVEEEDVVEEPQLDNDLLRWQTVLVNGQHKVIDLKLLEPFMKVLTHGGYHHENGRKAVIVVLTACNLPDRKMKRYTFIMEQLFFFLVSTMDILITSDEYIFVYFHGGADKNQSPSLSWLKKYYQYISRRLRKSVSQVYVVHPNLWLKSVFRLCRPFISSNFARKLKFVSSLKELSKYVKTDFIFIPDEVIRVDPNYKKVHSG